MGSAGLQAGCRAGLLTRASLLAAWTPPVQPVRRPALHQELIYGVDDGIEEQMGTHVGKEVRERMLEMLDEAELPFRLARKAGVEDGWLRAVRLAVGTTVEELAFRQGVQQREI